MQDADPRESFSDASRQLASSSHSGSEMKLPWHYRNQTVDEQLSDAADRLIKAKSDKPVCQAEMLASPPSSGASKGKARRKIVVERAASKMEAVMKVKKIFIPSGDLRYDEMVRFVDDLPAIEEKVQKSTRNPLGDSWVAEFRISLDTMLAQLSMTFDPNLGEEQLCRIYEWFQIHKGGLQDCGRPTSAFPRSENLNFLEMEAGPVDGRERRPGSAFYVPTDRYGDYEEEAEAEAEKETSIVLDEGSMASRLTSVQLPPARERLHEYATRLVVTPLSAQKMKQASYALDDCQSVASTDRSFTPSTCTGGSYSARSASAFSARSTPTPGPLSARSSPTPLGGSRPSSAAGSHQRPVTPGRPWTPGRPQTPQGLYSADSAVGARPLQATRPFTAPKMGSRPPTLPSSTRTASGVAPPTQHLFHLREALEQETAEREMVTAQKNMEERWLLRRHRDIANEMVDEDRHAAVAAWAERRARVEEEIAYNAEAMRFQSDLRQRATILPADAEQDIPATEPPDDEPPDDEMLVLAGQSSTAQSKSVQRMATRPLSSQKPPSRHDVSQIAVEEIQVPGGSKSVLSLRESNPVKMDRITNLRRIHRHLLRASEEAEAADFDHDESDACHESIFQTEVGFNHISLSAYTPDSTQAALSIRNKDDADVVAAVCDNWSGCELALAPATETGESMHELRFKQQQEAEAVKRVLARRNCPFSAAVVDSALVMPPHFVKPGARVFNAEPNLKTDGIPAWYFQDRQKKKKPRTGKVAKKSSRRPKG